MPFAGVGGTSIRGGYLIDNSLRFNDNDSPYLSKTLSTPTNRKIWTYSTWVKRSTLGASKVILAHNKVGNPNSTLRFNSTADTIRFFDVNSGGTTVIDLITTQVFRDVSAFYHIVLSLDTSQATSSNRVKLYINGNQVTSFSTETYPSQNYDTTINSTEDVLEIGASNGGTNFDGYMAETYFIDGQQLSPTDFGEFDEDSGIWKPIQYTGSYGTNGFYLDFENSGSLGADQSGNGNNFTPTNLASTDQMVDTPTNNFCTVNALDHSGCTFSEGNLKLVTPTAGGTARATFGMSTGKWYWEVRATTNGNVSSLGILKTDNPVNQYLFQADDGYAYEANTGNKFNNGSGTSYGATYTTGDKIGISYDADAGDLEFFKNGVSQGTAFTGLTGTFAPAFSDGSGDTAVTYDINFGQNGSFNGTETAQGNADGNGYGDFYYAPPSGYLALCTQNLATELSPTIDDASAYFQATTYTGNSSTLPITSLNFQPDFLWIKRRSSASTHALLDSNRGGGKVLGSDNTDPENTNNNVLSSWNSDGFVIALSGVSAFTNTSGQTYVGWNWLVNGGTNSSNTDGSITSTVQANTTAGFSIVTYTGNSTTGATFGHGLGVSPAMFIIKDRSGAANWPVWNKNLTTNYNLYLNSTDAQFSAGGFAGMGVTSSLIQLPTGGTSTTNTSGQNYVCYAFAEIEGYSKFGSYEGNNSTDGTFVYLGFRPSFLIVKNIDNTSNWNMFDSTRNTFNKTKTRLFPNLSNAEEDMSEGLDFLSNGFKLRQASNNDTNQTYTYIYMAFAENPFVSSTGIPVVAR